MDSLYDLLSGKNFDEPPEIAAIKDYIRQKYNAEATVSIRDKDILVVIGSSSLASRLRFDIQNLREAAKTDKRIVLRIKS